MQLGRLWRIGVDLTGSDSPSHELVAALTPYFQDLSSSVELLLFTEGARVSGVSSIVVSQVVRMEDAPLTVLTEKPHSALVLGMQKLAALELDAFISAGNTGALLAAATIHLPKVGGLRRPALAAFFPTSLQDALVVDLGASFTHRASHFLLLAKLGMTIQKRAGIAHPTVGLLNIGHESWKGPKYMQQLYEEMGQTFGAQFVGNIEPKPFFEGGCSVLITDGFTGNIFLKTAEAIVSRYSRDLSLKESAFLLGVKGLVIKCHGAAGPFEWQAAIEQALRQLEKGLLTLR